MTQATDYREKKFWATESLKYKEPHFRLEKAARLVNKIARGRQCDLLDVGCGPATLGRLLQKNLQYFGIDIVVHEPASNLRESDLVKSPIEFGSRRFDIVLAQGVFEYVGTCQAQKFREIAELLREGGKFVVSYVNFDHRNIYVYPPYTNVQPFASFRNSLREVFQIDRIIPTSHHWHHHEPTRPLVKAIQMRMNANIPFLSPQFAIEYFLVCSHKKSEARR